VLKILSWAHGGDLCKPPSNSEVHGCQPSCDTKTSLSCWAKHELLDSRACKRRGSIRMAGPADYCTSYCCYTHSLHQPWTCIREPTTPIPVLMFSYCGNYSGPFGFTHSHGSGVFSFSQAAAILMQRLTIPHTSSLPLSGAILIATLTYIRPVFESVRDSGIADIVSPFART
jgi:hypothetical protein